MAERREYSERERAEALALAAEVGGAQAAEQLSIPRKTVNSWINRARASGTLPAATPKPAVGAPAGRPWAERRHEVAAELEELRVEVFERVRTARNGNDAKSYMVAAGIVVDKLEQLHERGGPGPAGQSGAPIDDELEEAPSGEAWDRELERLVAEHRAKLDEGRVTPDTSGPARPAPAPEVPEPPLPAPAEAEVARARRELEHVETELAALAPVAAPKVHRGDWRAATDGIDEWARR